MKTEFDNTKQRRIDAAFAHLERIAAIHRQRWQNPARLPVPYRDRIA